MYFSVDGDGFETGMALFQSEYTNFHNRIHFVLVNQLMKEALQLE